MTASASEDDAYASHAHAHAHVAQVSSGAREDDARIALASNGERALRFVKSDRNARRARDVSARTRQKGKNKGQRTRGRDRGGKGKGKNANARDTRGRERRANEEGRTKMNGEKVQRSTNGGDGGGGRTNGNYATFNVHGEAHREGANPSQGGGKRAIEREISRDETEENARGKKKLLAPSGDLAPVNEEGRRMSAKSANVSGQGKDEGDGGVTRAKGETEGERLAFPRESRRHATSFEDNPRYDPSKIRVQLPSFLPEPAEGEWIDQTRLLDLCREGSFIDVSVSSLTSATLHAVKNAVRKDPPNIIKLPSKGLASGFIRAQVMEHFVDESGWVVTTVRVLPETMKDYRMSHASPTSGKGLIKLVFNLCEEAAYGCLRLYKLEPNSGGKRARTYGTASPSTFDSEVVIHQPGTPPRKLAPSTKKPKYAGSSDPDTQTPPDAIHSREPNFGLPQSARKDPSPSSTNAGTANRVEEVTPTDSDEAPSHATTSSHDVTEEGRQIGDLIKVSDNMVQAPKIHTTIAQQMAAGQIQSLHIKRQQQRQQLHQQLQRQQDILRQEQAEDDKMLPRGSASTEMPVLYDNVADYYARMVNRPALNTVGDVPSVLSAANDRARLEAMFLNDTYSPRAQGSLPLVSQHLAAQQKALARQQMPPPVSVPVQRIANPSVYYLPVPISPQSSPGTVTHAVLGGMRVRVIVESLEPPHPAAAMRHSGDVAADMARHHSREVREPDTSSLSNLEIDRARARAKQQQTASGKRRHEDDDDMVAANLLMLKTSMPVKKPAARSRSSRPPSTKPPKKMANLSTF